MENKNRLKDLFDSQNRSFQLYNQSEYTSMVCFYSSLLCINYMKK